MNFSDHDPSSQVLSFDRVPVPFAPHTSASSQAQAQSVFASSPFTAFSSSTPSSIPVAPSQPVSFSSSLPSHLTASVPTGPPSFPAPLPSSFDASHRSHLTPAVEAPSRYSGVTQEDRLYSRSAPSAFDHPAMRSLHTTHRPYPAAPHHTTADWIALHHPQADSWADSPPDTPFVLDQFGSNQSMFS
mmetsp:Transcript_43347/g.109474  ORF Transcript_43347/g.109474 Transcript_43347/m.109474 type:complete len:187 (+) Transcript_43347:216-776(+)|eukprot:CAMPEP_0177657194 /NCGR_PEP_ID=MMETSP0447-20121125/16038_1 /TAXON_ID=0 /ORGANISM="Stygamoeba regulata, Strain BSH-02190019" /LENGTH=186 /DNA_ID=CAMNT_0019161499 /DNA_START=208 /DNA_END=768 /DNA_ORIENTATION=+